MVTDSSGGVFKRELTEEEVLEFYRNRGEVTVNEETKEEEIDTYDQIDNLIENNIYYFQRLSYKTI
jgi:hypothetical protein